MPIPFSAENLFFFAVIANARLLFVLLLQLKELSTASGLPERNRAIPDRVPGTNVRTSTGGKEVSFPGMRPSPAGFSGDCASNAQIN